eukprot:SM000076S21848  [mRNA]  locus=s76:597472:600938:+ [translate_table: standard]
MALKLHTFPSNKNAYKCLVAAEYVGVKVDVPEWDPDSFKSGKIKQLTPIGKVPVLETPSGAIFESNAIARYVSRLADKGLYGSSLIDMAHIEQWIDFSVGEIEVPIRQWIGPLMGYRPWSQESEDFAIAAVKRGLGALNSHLESSTYLVGSSVTLADIIVVCNLVQPFKYACTKDFTAEFPHVERYFFTLINQANFKKVIGNLEQAKQPLQSPPAAKAQSSVAAPATPTTPAKEDSEGAAEAGAAGASAIAAAAAVAAAKPTESAPAATPPSSSMDEEDEAPKPKAKNPLDTLPPSPMIMDAWKRLYSNTKAKEFREVAIKGFWEMYDPEGYSLWFCDYKYNDENQVPYVTMNKVSGFLQRMDLARKYAFAKLCILGDKAPYEIRGFWLFRGVEIPPFVMDECYDCELYEWTKVDISIEEQKELINQYMEEPDVIHGLPLLEAKCFK